MTLMYFLASKQSIHLESMGRESQGLYPGPDREASARHELMLGGTHLKKPQGQ